MVATPIARFNSFADLRKVTFDQVQIERSGGGFFKARFHGQSNFCFGVTPQEALAKLRSGDLCGRTPSFRFKSKKFDVVRGTAAYADC